MIFSFSELRKAINQCYYAFDRENMDKIKVSIEEIKFDLGGGQIADGLKFTASDPESSTKKLVEVVLYPATENMASTISITENINKAI